MKTDVCGVSWCLAGCVDGKEFCALHVKLPALAGEKYEDWMRRAPIRARRAAIEARVLAAIAEARDTTRLIAKHVEETPHSVRRAVQALMRRAAVIRKGKGRNTRYEPAPASATGAA